MNHEGFNILMDSIALQLDLLVAKICIPLENSHEKILEILRFEMETLLSMPPCIYEHTDYSGSMPLCNVVVINRSGRAILRVCRSSTSFVFKMCKCETYIIIHVALGYSADAHGDLHFPNMGAYGARQRFASSSNIKNVIDHVRNLNHSAPVYHFITGIHVFQGCIGALSDIFVRIK